MSVKVIVFILALSTASAELMFKIKEIEDGFFAELKKQKHADKDRGEDSYMTTPQSMILGDGIGGCEFSSKFISQMLVSAIAKHLVQNGPALTNKPTQRAAFRNDILTVVNGEIQKFADLFMTSFYLEIDKYVNAKDLINEQILPTSTTMVVTFIQNGPRPVMTVFQKGDSGIAVFRKFSSVGGAGSYYKLHFLSSEQQSNFNQPYQFVSEPHHKINNELDAVYNVDIRESDIVIQGSDGLFDNVPVGVLNFFVNYLIKLYNAKDYKSAMKRDVFSKFVLILYDKFKQSKDKIEKQIKFYADQIKAKRTADQKAKNQPKDANPLITAADLAQNQPGVLTSTTRGSRPADFDVLYQNTQEAAKRKQEQIQAANAYQSRARLIRQGSRDSNEILNKVIEQAGEKLDPASIDPHMGQFRSNVIIKNEKLVQRVTIETQKEKIELFQGRTNAVKGNFVDMNSSLRDMSKDLSEIRNRVNQPNPYSVAQSRRNDPAMDARNGMVMGSRISQTGLITMTDLMPQIQGGYNPNPQRISNVQFQGGYNPQNQNGKLVYGYHRQRRLARQNKYAPSIQVTQVNLDPAMARNPGVYQANPTGQNTIIANTMAVLNRESSYNFNYRIKREAPNTSGTDQKIQIGGPVPAQKENLIPGGPAQKIPGQPNGGAPRQFRVQENEQIFSDHASFQDLIDKFIKVNSLSILGLTASPNANKSEKDPSVTEQDIDSNLNDYFALNFAFTEHELNIFRTRFSSKEFSTPIALAAKTIAVQNEYFPSVFYIRSRFDSDKDFPAMAKDDDISVATGLVINSNLDKTEFDYSTELDMLNYIRSEMISSLPQAVGTFVEWLMGTAKVQKKADDAGSPERLKAHRQITEKLKAF